MQLLETHKLSIGYSRKKEAYVVQNELDLCMKTGELVCLIGPNGSGKSTLLRTLCGLQPPLTGKVKIEGKNIEKVSHAERAALLSVVLTDRIDVENATVHTIVSYGRHPHSNWWGTLSDKDEALISRAMQMLHLEHMSQKYFAELSDGEKQRALIAKAFVQDTPLVVLDEPTAHLDLPTRIEILLLLHELAHKTNTAVILSTHELDIALQAADKIWLMTDHGGITTGVPEDLVLNGSFDSAFRNENYIFNPSNGNFSMNYPMDKKISVGGNKLRMYWTLRALARAGYQVVENADIKVDILENAWLYNGEELPTVEALLHKLKVS